MVHHIAQYDIRNPICDCFTAKSHKLMEVKLHNGTSEIRFVIVALQSHTNLCSVNCTMVHHIAQYDIRNPICDCFTAKSHKPMEGHIAQHDIRNPICDCCTAKSHKPMGVILCNGTSEI